ncbi:MAG: hypothetical protein AAF399_20595 [Bacteroidota bacterium]
MAEAKAAVQQQVEALFLGQNSLTDERNFSYIQIRVQKPGPYQQAVLDLYEQVLQQGVVSVQPQDKAHFYLKLTGLTQEIEGQLRLNNSIYQRVFDSAWVEEVRQSIQRPFEADLQRWLTNANQPDFLLTGERLKEGLAWQQAQAEAQRFVSPQERFFLNASVQAEQEAARLTRERQRQNRRLTLALIGVGIVAVIAIFFGIRSTSIAANLERLSEALSITTQAEQLGDQHPNLSLALADYAYNLYSDEPLIQQTRLDRFRASPPPPGPETRLGRRRFLLSSPASQWEIADYGHKWRHRTGLGVGYGKRNPALRRT